LDWADFATAPMWYLKQKTNENYEVDAVPLTLRVSDKNCSSWLTTVTALASNVENAGQREFLALSEVGKRFALLQLPVSRRQSSTLPRILARSGRM
jgi:hypothetical protein